VFVSALLCIIRWHSFYHIQSLYFRFFCIICGRALTFSTTLTMLPPYLVNLDTFTELKAAIASLYSDKHWNIPVETVSRGHLWTAVPTLWSFWSSVWRHCMCRLSYQHVHSVTRVTSLRVSECIPTYAVTFPLSWLVGECVALIVGVVAIMWNDNWTVSASPSPSPSASASVASL